MEIRIGIQHVNREVVLESNESLAAVQKLIDAALANGSLLTLTDEKGRTVIVPGDKIAFIEIGAQASGRVGFATTS
ncbi:MAG: DUF3107 domain-containing protein [Candidatus Nanopelagicales bacterium]|nr:DUF3107 domain-containing protein [Candidatus Nanopelagicales bacterium]